MLKQSSSKSIISYPTALISPKIDGNISNFFEWKNAGEYSVGYTGGSMHQVSTVIKNFMFGFDLNNIYISILTNIPLNSKDIENLHFNINFLIPVVKKISARFDMDNNVVEFIVVGNGNKISVPLENIAVKTIVEMAIPLSILKLPDNYKNIEFTISVDKDYMEIERWPYQSSVIIPKPSENFNENSWMV